MGGGMSFGGKGQNEDKGLFDWMFNPIGSLTGKLWGIELDPIGSMAASQATNISSMIQGDDPERLWFGDSWWGDLGTEITGEQTRAERFATIQDEEERAEEARRFRARYGPGDSLLADEEE